MILLYSLPVGHFPIPIPSVPRDLVAIRFEDIGTNYQVAERLVTYCYRDDSPFLTEDAFSYSYKNILKLQARMQDFFRVLLLMHSPFGITPNILDYLDPRVIEEQKNFAGVVNRLWQLDIAVHRLICDAWPELKTLEYRGQRYATPNEMFFLYLKEAISRRLLIDLDLPSRDTKTKERDFVTASKSFVLGKYRDLDSSERNKIKKREMVLHHLNKRGVFGQVLIRLEAYSDKKSIKKAMKNYADCIDELFQFCNEGSRANIQDDQLVLIGKSNRQTSLQLGVPLALVPPFRPALHIQINKESIVEQHIYKVVEWTAREVIEGIPLPRCIAVLSDCL